LVALTVGMVALEADVSTPSEGVLDLGRASCSTARQPSYDLSYCATQSLLQGWLDDACEATGY